MAKKSKRTNKRKFSKKNIKKRPRRKTYKAKNMRGGARGNTQGISEKEQLQIAIALSKSLQEDIIRKQTGTLSGTGPEPEPEPEPEPADIDDFDVVLEPENLDDKRMIETWSLYNTLLESLEKEESKPVKDAIIHYKKDSERLLKCFFGIFKGGRSIVTIEDTILFIEAIFDSISIIHYPVDNSKSPLYRQKKGTRNRQIPRTNHGGLNHIRSVVFCCDYMLLLKNKNRTFYDNLFPEEIHENLAIINSMFHALMRICEGRPGGLFSLDEKKINEIYPLIGEIIVDIFKNEAEQPRQHIQQYVSSILFISLMKTILPEEYHEYIEYLALAHSFYIGHSSFNNRLMEEYLTDSINDDEKKIYTYITLGQIGHYLDHCRGPFSNMIDSDQFKLLNRILMLTPEEKKDIIDNVLKLLTITEFTGEYLTEGNMSIRCSSLTGRYENPNFKEYQLNFKSWSYEQLWETIGALKVS